MKLCDCFVQTGTFEDGEYIYKNKKFPEYQVKFIKNHFDIDKIYLRYGEPFDDFESDNDLYMLLMAMIQNDGWELCKQ